MQAANPGDGNDGGSDAFSTNSIGPSNLRNMSNTSLSSATNSSRGNISQSGGNQSGVSLSSQRSLGHQQSSANSSQQQNPNFDSNVISERVKNLATQIYQELKRIISRCNYDEDLLSGLMPLIVRVLESLDLALIENQQLQVELELCKDDNEQLVIMFDKEKAAKRAIDKKLIESDYAYDEERQQYQQKIESLDNAVKMYELRAKNASDQAARFEEKEAERKKEYNKLHDRYTELLKSHCDIVERCRQLTGSSEIANLNVPHQMVGSIFDSTAGELQPHPLNKLRLSNDDEFHDKNTVSIRGTERLKTWNADTELTLEDASLVVIDDIVGGSGGEASHHSKAGDGSSHNESDRATSEPGEGEQEKESENDSIAYTSMEREFRKLIQENKDLLNTKNALNVVKDDLIAEVDRLTNEISMFEQAVEQLNLTKDQMKQKVSTLDAELRKTKEELEKAKQKIKENNEEGVPYSQRKRFGRAEMAKVLMERNNYKERFMELQDAVRYTELVRANRIETEKRSGLWKFFSNLFGPPPPPTRAILGSPRDSSPVVSYNNSTGGTSVTATDPRAASQMVAADALQVSGAGRAPAGGSTWSASRSSSSAGSGSGNDCIVLMDSDVSSVGDRNRAGSRDGGGGGGASGGGVGATSDGSGYIHAYGWSLRASSIKELAASSAESGGSNQAMSSRISPILGGTSTHTSADESVSFSTKLTGLQVPIPQHCRPLTGDSLGMKIWCATAIDRSGGDLAKCTRPIVEVAGDNEVTEKSTNSTVGGEDSSSSSLVNISTSTPVKSPPGKNEQALRDLEHDVNQLSLAEGGSEPLSSLTSSSKLPILKTTTELVLSALPFADDDVEELSTMVWICSTQHSRSKITIIDMQNKPNELLDSFYVPTFLYCIKSIPGCKPSDLLGLASNASPTPTATAAERSGESPPKDTTSKTQNPGITMSMINELIANQRDHFYKLVQVDPKAESRLRRGRIEVEKILREQVAATTGSTDGTNQEDINKLINESIIELTTKDGDDKLQATACGANDDSEISRLLENSVPDGIATLQKLNDFVAHTQPQETTIDAVKPDQGFEGAKGHRGSSGHTAETDTARGGDASYYQPISTHLSTVWMGGKDCVLYIHSAMGQWKDCVACVELPDSILQICHYRGRAFVALADGSLCVFFRSIDTRQWDFSRYLLINIGLMNEVTSDSLLDVDASDATPSSAGHSRLSNLILDDDVMNRSTELDEGSQSQGASQSAHSSPSKTPTASPSHPAAAAAATSATTSRRSSTPTNKRRGKVSGVHCLEIANKNLWLGHRNRVLIFDPITMRLKHAFNVVPQVDNQIRQMVAMKDSVFICLRSDLTLRLYSSLRPYQHIQNIDIEPVVTRLISPKTFVISHITSMRVADNTLWIGIAHGIILTIPCKLVPQISEAPMRNSLTGEFEESPSHLSIARFVPKCDTNTAQVSFHGHRDAVKFFVHANNLMLSGGQGYLDFRLDTDEQSKTISDKSHLILWQLPQSH